MSLSAFHLIAVNTCCLKTKIFYENSFADDSFEFIISSHRNISLSLLDKITEIPALIAVDKESEKIL
jgi:hypothetical protein